MLKRHLEEQENYGKKLEEDINQLRKETEGIRKW